MKNTFASSATDLTGICDSSASLYCAAVKDRKQGRFGASARYVTIVLFSILLFKIKFCRSSSVDTSNLDKRKKQSIMENRPEAGQFSQRPNATMAIQTNQSLTKIHNVNEKELIRDVNSSARRQSSPLIHR